jgi:GNAT superfamily N-acetyltransferase
VDREKPEFVIQPFSASDAEACFAVRQEAYTRVFSHELAPEAVNIGANAYDLEEFGRRVADMHSFVARERKEPIGFCTVRLLNAAIAEILYLYVRLDRHKQGIGTALVSHVERWLAKQYTAVATLVLDTAVPLYNQRFWEGLGYSVTGDSQCKYPGGEVPAVRLGKRLQ